MSFKEEGEKESGQARPSFVVVARSSNIKNVDGPFIIEGKDNKTPEESMKFSDSTLFQNKAFQARRTFWDVCKEHPIVPVGALITTGVLAMGIRSVARKDSASSQFWMRMRVIAQGLTFVGALYSLVAFGTRESSPVPVTQYDSSVRPRPKQKPSSE